MSMDRHSGSDRALARYRTGYLKMRSVLHDRTTGLPALPLLFDELRSMLDARRELGVLHVEAANLGLVESLYGWQVFDRIVARMAAVLRGAIGATLPAATRLAVSGVAGDRFVLFVPEQPAGAAADAVYLAGAAEAVRRELEAEFGAEEFAGLNPALRFHAGHALLSQNPFFRFERCVYAAVRQARASHGRRERRREVGWGEELRDIIDRGAVETVFQPLLDLGTRELLGHEALVRGPRDTLFEAPRALFALSGQAGVATELDALCCEAALAAFVLLDGRRKLFLNVLPSSLDGDTWRRGRLRSLVGELSVAPQELVLELSERGGAGGDAAPLVRCVGRCREEGFGVALDDVGTGRTDLETLERARPDYLKLDVSLVRNIDASVVQQDVLLTLVRLAERIQAAVIGEGVETEEEARTLVACGARYAQGYFFAAPAPPRPPRASSAGPPRGH
jgi:EAL domain-containing protein (putative c-di-GMP-specific phosphodiesterase class I)/GGDEF domain-containing protein